ncbi:YfjI family protein [Ectothiorhodospira variabilis]|uniref:YfjI family protein n=1 Tax=Ectothiorhodospira variabilis TaxID=505694 RepID=UPI001EFB52F0|nr:YfjI family protein [Ectothiorhodospira variabilis]MCG5498984.1 DUF3987 domain-containing protein [Ectothiorhodospira variabilis]
MVLRKKTEDNEFSVNFQACQPLPPRRGKPPEVNELMLPSALRAWVLDASERMQCPPDYIAVGTIIALSAIVGRQIAIRPKKFDDWTIVINLWGAIVGPPGYLKSPAFAESNRFLNKLEDEAAQANTEKLLQHKIDMVIKEAYEKVSDKNLKKAANANDHEKAYDFALEKVSYDKEAPPQKRYVTSDPTIEKLGELLVDNPRGIAVYRDELVGLIKNLERPGQEGARTFFLEGWNGSGSYTFDRIRRGTVRVKSICLTVFGSIQPGPLYEYLRRASEGGAGDDGLLQRFQLMIYPDQLKEYVDIDRAPDEEALKQAEAVFRRMDNIDPVALGASCDDGGIPYLRFSDDAYEEFRTWRSVLENRIRKGEDHPLLNSLIAKQRSLVPSLSLLFHLVDHPAGGPVSYDSLIRAIAWCEYLEEHAKFIYRLNNSALPLAVYELDKHIQKGDLPNPFTARDVYRKKWTLLNQENVEVALRHLVELGRLAPVETKGPGRSTEVFHIHPDLCAGD